MIHNTEISSRIAELAAMADTRELRAMRLEYEACRPTAVEVAMPAWRNGIVTVHSVALDFYLHRATLRRGRFAVVKREWTPSVELGRVELGKAFDVPVIEGDRLMLEIEYAGPLQRAAFRARVDHGWTRDGDAGPWSVRRSVSMTADDVPRSEHHGAAMTLVLDDRVIFVIERRPGVIADIQEFPLAQHRSIDAAWVADRAKIQRLPRPIAVRRFTRLSRHGDGEVSLCDLLTGYDDERGWMFAFGRGPNGDAIVEMNATGYTPTWLGEHVHAG
jgi:hypothetical protein